MWTVAERSFSAATSRTLSALTRAWLARIAARRRSGAARSSGLADGDEASSPIVAASSLAQPKSIAATIAS